MNKFREIDDDSVANEVATKANFLVSTMNKIELSELTHRFHIWVNKQDEIMKSGNMNVELEESDFDEHDQALADKQYIMYSLDYINSVKVIKVEDSYFIFDKESYSKITELHETALEELADKEQENLTNPVYVTIAEDGVLEID